jgi:hypothetical protein
MLRRTVITLPAGALTALILERPGAAQEIPSTPELSRVVAPGWDLNGPGDFEIACRVKARYIDLLRDAYQRPTVEARNAALNGVALSELGRILGIGAVR